MELAFNKAAQRRAVEQPRKKVNGPRDAAKMAVECLGDSHESVTGARMYELARKHGWDISRDMANKVAKWHADMLRSRATQ